MIMSLKFEPTKQSESQAVWVLGSLSLGQSESRVVWVSGRLSPGKSEPKACYLTICHMASSNFT